MSTRLNQKDKEKVKARKTVANIIEYLKVARQPLSLNFLSSTFGVNIANNDDIKYSLDINEKIIFVGNTYQYKPKITGIKNKEDLQRYLDDNILGVFEKDLNDAYEGCEKDIKDLIKCKRIVAIYNNEKKTNRLFWYPGLTGNKDDNKEDFPLIDESIKLTWRDISIPNSKQELERTMNDKHIISQTFITMNRKRKLFNSNKPQPKRRKQSLRKLNLTNQHMAKRPSMLD